MNRTELIKDLKRREESQTAPIEQYFQTTYVAKRLSLSRGMVHKIFKNHPGVIFVGQTGNSGKRSYATMLIPESALLEIVAKRAS